MSPNNWAESFAALVNAYEQIKPEYDNFNPEIKKQHSTIAVDSASSTASSSQMESYPRQNKRKNLFDEPVPNKSLRASLNQFCSRFDGSVVVDESRMMKHGTNSRAIYDIYPTQEFSYYMAEYLESLSRMYKVDVNAVKAEWATKKNELESNISMIVNGFPSDSYDDARLLVLNVVECTNWLCGENYQELERMIPLFKLHQSKIIELTRFIKIVEDVRDTNFPIVVPDLGQSCERILAFLLGKKEIYGGTLQHGSIAWRVLGFPVDEVDRDLKIFREQVFALIITILTKVNQYAQYFNSHSAAGNNWERFNLISLDSIYITSIAFQILGHGPHSNSILELASNISHLYLQKADFILKELMNEKQFKLPDSKICCIYENIVQLFKHLVSIPSGDEKLQDNDGISMDCDEFSVALKFANLFHPSIELGIELCEYCHSQKRPASKKFKPMVFNICKRYLSNLSNLMQDCLDPDILTRVAHISTL